ncbi:GNAT family N-acetyltransferase [Candidatus Thiothrix sp. Deng01]|uniref:GNAT family N-acetyltransferase n=1 Tax=Candidatus Thiothrix phosphatis TaxID=3112415 RepID=A0ABU6CTH1_9GAMM|nr:GNAT family N-acetyltransferase [Candidatus Thiothrix sp. Deng01]MEB4590141.1 GNAT family N-acetyltransferase [Candidatus Thiothrix sp. Deng01]
MSITITPDLANAQKHDSVDIFTSPAFRSIIAHEFKLQAVQVTLALKEQVHFIPAFTRNNLLGGKTLILGAGFDKTGVILGVNAQDYGHVIEQLAQELTATDIKCLEIRTTQHIPCLPDEADKVELNVDIQPSVEAVWESLSTNTRKNIRRPLKRGFTSIIGTTPKLLDEFYQLYRMSLHDIGSLPHPKPFFADLLAQCPEQTEIFVGYMDNLPVVSSISFTNQDEIYGAWSGIHSDYKKHNVFLAMLWQMVEHCGETGRKTYNLGRSSADSNPYQFKLKLANRVHKIYYYRLPITSPRKTRSHTQDAASWLIRNTPEIVMDGLSRTLLHRFY